jgi:hypothetical protein
MDQLQTALTAALQPVLARLDALETGLARPPTDVHPPPTVDPHTSTRDPQTVDRPSWTVYVPQTMKDEIQRLARDRQQPPSVILQELLWQALRGR